MKWNKILLYNLSDNMPLKFVLYHQNFSVTDVKKENYSQEIGYLMHLDDFYRKEASVTEDLEEEMIILYDVEDEKMEALNQLLEVNRMVIRNRITVSGSDLHKDGITVYKEKHEQ